MKFIMKDNLHAQSTAKFIQSQATLDLVDKLSPFVTFEKYPARSRFYYFADGVAMCYIVRSGQIKVHRDADELVIAAIPVPNVCGISNASAITNTVFLETLSETEIAILTTAEAQQLVAETNAWESLAGHIAKVTTNLYHHNVIMTAPTTYEVVRFQLLTLMQEDTSIRETTSAAKYILERTRVSRSTVMKILAQLRQGNYIELDDGVLKAIHHLPAKY